MKFEPTHGLSQERLYSIWWGMMQRCYHQDCESYKNYGGRGITVCERWHDVKNFFADMVERPEKGLTIERIDNDKGYSPGNCRWATRKEQSRNQRKTVRMTHNGESHTFSEWAEITGISEKTLRHRALVFKWTPEEVLKTPVMSRADATKKGRDMRNTVKITHNGQTHSLAEWSKITGISYNTLRDRLLIRKWTPEEVLTMPVASLLECLKKATLASQRNKPGIKHNR